jgi:hypothetical protein
MHTGIISFCDRVGYNIKSSETKEDILRELHARFQIQILQRHWHRLDAEGVQQLARCPHLTCLRSNGNPYYMFFSRYEDVPIIYFVDKKIQPGYQVPRVILSRGKWDEALFDGSLLEGEMVKDQYGGWVFLINDVIGHEGTFLWKLTLPERIEFAYRMLQTQYVADPLLDVCKYQVKRYAHATQQGIDALLSMAKELPYTSRGIYFWPFARRFKPKLYNFDESLIKTVIRKVKDTPDFREAGAQEPPSRSPSPPAPPTASPPFEDAATGTKVMWLRKTENPDVYDVCLSSHMSSQKDGIAHVPTLASSKMLRAEFKDATVAVSIPFHCTYDAAKQKWVPLRKATT